MPAEPLMPPPADAVEAIATTIALAVQAAIAPLAAKIAALEARPVWTETHAAHAKAVAAELVDLPYSSLAARVGALESATTSLPGELAELQTKQAISAARLPELDALVDVPAELRALQQLVGE